MAHLQKHRNKVMSSRTMFLGGLGFLGLSYYHYETNIDKSTNYALIGGELIFVRLDIGGFDPTRGRNHIQDAFNAFN